MNAMTLYLSIAIHMSLTIIDVILCAQDKADSDIIIKLLANIPRIYRELLKPLCTFHLVILGQSICPFITRHSPKPPYNM